MGAGVDTSRLEGGSQTATKHIMERITKQGMAQSASVHDDLGTHDLFTWWSTARADSQVQSEEMLHVDIA